jgi:cytosine/adenosine deaminase-related metal-dependent hydrolase
LNWLPGNKQYLFVHNTYTTAKEVAAAQQHCANTYWCLCPNANIYIENRLPDITMLIAANASICIGTDSLASNHQLSILSELHTIRAHYPDINWEILLKWGTIGGAKALQMEETIGTIEPGKQPGILQLLPNGTTDEPAVVNRIV